MIAKILNINLNKKEYGLHKIKLIFIESNIGGEVNLEIDDKLIYRDTYNLWDKSKENEYYFSQVCKVLDGANMNYTPKDNEYVLIIGAILYIGNLIKNNSLNIVEYFSVKTL